MTSGVLDPARIPNLDAGLIGSGTLDAGRLPVHSADLLSGGKIQGDMLPDILEGNHVLDGWLGVNFLVSQAQLAERDGSLSVNYDGVIPVLVEAVQSLDQQSATRLAEKETRIAELEARIARLEDVPERRLPAETATRDPAGVPRAPRQD